MTDEQIALELTKIYIQIHSGQNFTESALTDLYIYFLNQIKIV